MEEVTDAKYGTLLNPIYLYESDTEMNTEDEEGDDDEDESPAYRAQSVDFETMLR